MRILAIALLHLIPLALVLTGQWAYAIASVVILHLTILAGTLVPAFPLFGKLVKKTSSLPEGIADANSVMLTFDDGPHPEFTPQILDLLDEYETRAVFFVIGNKAIQHPDIIKDIVARGHIIGNHTQNHPERRFWRLPASETAREIDQCQSSLETLTGSSPGLFRPPVGMHNPFLFDVLHQRSLPCVLWTHRGLDTTSNNVDAIVNRLTKNLSPGSIILIHDHLPKSVEITRRTLEAIRGSQLILAAKN